MRKLRNTYPAENSYETEFGTIGESISLPDIFKTISEKIGKNGFRKLDSKIKIKGKFSDNKVYIDRYDLSDGYIRGVDVDSINFILKLNYQSGSYFYTSYDYLNELRKEYQSSIPYKILSSLFNIVEVDVEPILQSISNFVELEKADAVDVSKNLFVDIDNGSITNVDFQSLIQYIAWVVSEPPSDYENRLLKVQDISEYELTRVDIEDEDETESDSETDSSNQQGGLDGSNFGVGGSDGNRNLL